MRKCRNSNGWITCVTRNRLISERARWFRPRRSRKAQSSEQEVQRRSRHTHAHTRKAKIGLFTVAPMWISEFFSFFFRWWTFSFSFTWLILETRCWCRLMSLWMMLASFRCFERRNDFFFRIFPLFCPLFLLEKRKLQVGRPWASAPGREEKIHSRGFFTSVHFCETI